MDLDAFVSAHTAQWDRLAALTRRASRPSRLSGAEVDELVALYQQAATHLSVVQTRGADPQLVARLSRLVAGARGAVAGARTPAWRQVGEFFAVTFPVTAYRAARWWVPTAVVSLAVALALGVWVDTHPDVQRSLLPPEEARALVNSQFAGYYHDHPAQDFALQVWTNNVWASAQALIGGLTLGGLTIYALVVNMVNLGVVGGFLVAAGKGSVFFGLITPHGLLELTAVFVAAGLGLKLAWTIVDPGPRSRSTALAAETRAAVTVALGLVVVLAVSGAIEAFVTPSSLPTWARVLVGLVAEGCFLGYVVVLGRAGVRVGATGDLAAEIRGDVVPTTG